MVSLGAKYTVTSGFMEIAYDTGARVILEGPATYEIESANGGYLAVGKLTARVEKKGSGVRGQGPGVRGQDLGAWGERTANLSSSSQRKGEPTTSLAPRPLFGKSEIRNPKSEIFNPQSLIPNPLFSVRTPTAVVADLGTEFGVEVDASGATWSHVFRGRVAMYGVGQRGASVIQLQANESARAMRGANQVVSVIRKPSGPTDFLRQLPTGINAGLSGESSQRGRALPHPPATLPRVPSYRLTDLGTLGGVESCAIGINAAGQVVGASTTASGATHAFLYADGVMKDLGTLGGNISQAYGVNNKRQVVGYAETRAGRPHAFFYSGGTMKDLGTFGGPGSTAYGINDAGLVTGATQDSSGMSHAFLYSQGKMIDLGTPGTGSWGYRLNSAGQVAGYATVHGEVTTHAVLFHGAAAPKDLGTLGGFNTFAHGINNRGQVVGGSTPASSTAVHAFFYSSGEGMKDLGTLGGRNSRAEDINDRGQAVGTAENAGGDWHALLYEGKTMIDLNVLIDPASGWTLVGAIGINSSGQIVGHGTAPNGYNRAFLLTPLAKARDAGATDAETTADAGATVELSPQHQPHKLSPQRQAKLATTRGERRGLLME